MAFVCFTAVLHLKYSAAAALEFLMTMFLLLWYLFKLNKMLTFFCWPLVVSDALSICKTLLSQQPWWRVHSDVFYEMSQGWVQSGKAESFQQAVASGTFTTWLKHTGWVWLVVHVLIFWTIKCSFACFWTFFFCLHRMFSTLCLQRSTLPSSAWWPWRHTGSLERCSEG